MSYATGVPTSVDVARSITYASAVACILGGLVFVGLWFALGIVMLVLGVVMFVLGAKLNEANRTARNILVAFYAAALVFGLLVSRNLFRMAVEVLVIYLLVVNKQSREFFSDG